MENKMKKYDVDKIFNLYKESQLPLLKRRGLKGDF